MEVKKKLLDIEVKGSGDNDNSLLLLIQIEQVVITLMLLDILDIRANLKIDAVSLTAFISHIIFIMVAYTLQNSYIAVHRD
ncbi:MAG: hypothetical protein Q9M36_03670 [Sulfurovum sp.]|nr:hypothetical protein [Sulfurovum sp.]